MGRVSIEFTIGVICLIVFCVVCIHIWWTERKRILTAPRIPMSLCDRHGAYPSSASIWYTIPEEGKSDLVQEGCPLCYKDRLDQAKEKLNAGT